MSKYSDIIRKSEKLDVDDKKCATVHTQSHTEKQIYAGYGGTCKGDVEPKHLRSRNCDYDEWEYAYFDHLLNLRNLYVSRVSRLYPEHKEYLYSAEFMEHFGRFMFSLSDKRISPFLTQNSNEFYSEYLFKKMQNR